MNSSRRFPSHALVLVGGALAFLTTASPLSAQNHRIIQKSGAENVGQIEGVNNGTVSIKVAAGSIGVPLRNIARVEMPAPPAVAQAQEAYLKGDAATAFSLVTPVADRFAGLPVGWSKQAVQLKAEAALAIGDVAAGKSGFEMLEKVYDDKQAATIGMARVNLEEGKLEEARKVLEPLIKSALEDPAPDSLKGVQYGQTALAYGILQEKAGRFPEALEYYILAKAVFDSDPATSAIAEARAQAVRETHGAIVP